MNISELIERLEDLKSEHGDRQVWIGKDAGIVRCGYVEFDEPYGVVIE